MFSSRRKRQFTGLLYSLNIKPTVNKWKRSPLDKGIVVFSADFEMAWAFRYSKSGRNAENMGLQERGNTPVILGLFDRNKLPVTWATVGHLFLKECKCTDRIPHPEMARPQYFENKNWRFHSGDWYDSDPCSDIDKAPAWYASDLIGSILSSSIKHEIACHSFSHIDFSYKNCTPELAFSELDACKKLASQMNISLTSMVFPGGTLGNFETLAKMGFTAYRRPMRNDIDLPNIDKYGLVSIPSSYGLDGSHELFSPKKYISMANSYVKSAMKYKQICHFWFHPSMNPWYMNNVLPEILTTVAEYRDKGQIRVLTMSQIAKEYLLND